jgi:hypothetical protein
VNSDNTGKIFSPASGFVGDASSVGATTTRMRPLDDQVVLGAADEPAVERILRARPLVVPGSRPRRMDLTKERLS